MTIKRKITVICVQYAIVSMLIEKKCSDSFHDNYHMKYEGKSPSHPILLFLFIIRSIYFYFWKNQNIEIIDRYGVL